MIRGKRMLDFKLNLISNNSYASRILDSLRFLSALIVFLFHFYLPLPGSQAVMVFFVLSGYFISSSVLKVIEQDKWNWVDYLLRRLTRLWIVLLPALLLTFIWANIQLGLFGESLSPPNLRISNYLNLNLLFGNLFFLQGILTKGPFGLNGPLWSLTYEFWYYMLFPCLILIFRSNSRKKKILYLILSVGISTFIGTKIMEYFLIWLLGALIPLIRPLNLNNNVLKFIMVVPVSILAFASMYVGKGYFLDLRVGIMFAMAIYLVISFFNKRSSSMSNIPKHLAGFSYTLYLTHYPLANFILTWRMSKLWPFHGNSLFRLLAI
jgi:peptidoglycan/LPS O-acetylase OafA/YrhL